MGANSVRGDSLSREQIHCYSCVWLPFFTMVRKEREQTPKQHDWRASIDLGLAPPLQTLKVNHHSYPDGIL
jgi:hypothetical protein